mmetsp:Transcript_159453/g.511603  ORF Transcript_159453/g.511603 Transcript_159453/m.511603 type:complete len:314 (+) Transcript_159453:729-1670(+)
MWFLRRRQQPHHRQQPRHRQRRRLPMRRRRQPRGRGGSCRTRGGGQPNRALWRRKHGRRLARGCTPFDGLHLLSHHAKAATSPRSSRGLRAAAAALPKRRRRRRIASCCIRASGGRGRRRHVRSLSRRCCSTGWGCGHSSRRLVPQMQARTGLGVVGFSRVVSRLRAASCCGSARRPRRRGRPPIRQAHHPRQRHRAAADRTPEGAVLLAAGLEAQVNGRMVQATPSTTTNWHATSNAITPQKTDCGLRIQTRFSDQVHPTRRVLGPLGGPEQAAISVHEPLRPPSAGAGAGRGRAWRRALLLLRRGVAQATG